MNGDNPPQDPSPPSHRPRRIIQMFYLMLPCVIALCSCTATDTPPSPQITSQIEAAQRLLSADDADGALLITDKLLDANSSLRPALLIAAKANMELVKENRGSITPSLLEDAARCYRRALSIQADDATSWDSLADVLLQQEKYREGADAALRAAAIHRGNDPDAMAKSLLRAADHEMRIFVAARRAELASEDKAVTRDTESKAILALSRLEAVKQMLPGPGYHKASQIYAWLGKSIDELDQLERGIRNAPDYYDLHMRYREMQIRNGREKEVVAFYRSLLRDEGVQATDVYYLGMAESTLGDKYRRAGDRDAAERAYTAAVKSFTKCKKAEQRFATVCDNWIAIEYLSLAKMHEEAGDIEVATGHLEKAFETTPRVAQTNEQGQPLIYDSFGSYYFGTMNHLGKAIASGATTTALRDGLTFWERFLKKHPGEHGWMYNNAAFLARDLGTALENRKGTPDAVAKNHAEAIRLYERSYELYTVAAKLDPDDARTVNDTGLMLLYHLKRDYGLAEKLFKQAIQAGLAQVANLPDSTPERQRNVTEEALGDAYQNLGKLYMDLGRKFEEYAGPLRESVKYFPKQQRQSAIWLRRSAQPANATKNAPGRQDQQDKQDAKKKAFAKTAAAASQKAAAGDYDGALLELDKVSNEMVGYAPYHFYQGLYALRYAEQAAARGGGAGQVEGLFADARRQLQKSVAIDGEPVEPRLRLAEANFATGEFENAGKIAAALILHIGSLGGTTAELNAATQLVRAKAGTRLYIAAKQKRNDKPEELAGARNAFRNLEKRNRLDATSRSLWSTLEQWAGNKTGALDIFLRAQKKAPKDQAILGELVNAAYSTGQSARAVAALNDQDDAMSLWYTGMALFYSSYEKPAIDQPEAQALAIDKAIAKFDLCAAKQRTYKAACDQRVAICFGTKGFNALGRKDYKAAETFFLSAAERAPAHVLQKISGDYSVKTGFEFIVDHYYREKRDLPSAIKTLQKACKAIPSDAGLSNNLGLFARDHGNALERRGRPKEAKKLYEVSFQAYKSAVRLEPKSVRQRNDLMVMILYHVKRDLDTVVPTLKSCIVDGEKQLDEDPPEDATALRDLQEAVGDSYENLGYYYRHFGKDKSLAKANFEKSLEFWPNRRRRGVRWIRELDNDK